jgi:hypothetical protein
MAALIDSSGNGTVNYAGGATCLSFSRATGGFYFDEHGAILLSWSAKGAVTRRHDAYRGDALAVEARLGPNFAVRLVLASREFFLYFASKVCLGVCALKKSFDTRALSVLTLSKLCLW